MLFRKQFQECLRAATVQKRVNAFQIFVDFRHETSSKPPFYSLSLSFSDSEKTRFLSQPEHRLVLTSLDVLKVELSSSSCDGLKKVFLG